MAANPKSVLMPAGRFCAACGVALGEGTRLDECTGCRAYIRKAAKRTPAWVMKRRQKVALYDRRMALLLPGDVSTLDSAKGLKLQPLSKPHAKSELKAPTRPALRLIRGKR